MRVRLPAVAGTFYPADADLLRRQLDELFQESPSSTEHILACLVPHAGYIYSGRVAADVYARIVVPREVVILSFNHRGLGRVFALHPSGILETPLGSVALDEALCTLVRSAYAGVEYDETGHAGEHSAEVQVPMLRHRNPGVVLASIALTCGLSHEEIGALVRFGQGLAAVIERSGRDILVVASSDFNHYESREVTEKKDRKAIAQIQKLDEWGLADVLRKEHVSMCGYAPAIAMMAYAKARGAGKAVLVSHRTSGDVSGDYEHVVGYAGLIVPGGR